MDLWDFYEVGDVEGAGFGASAGNGASAPAPPAPSTAPVSMTVAPSGPPEPHATAIAYTTNPDGTTVAPGGIGRGMTRAAAGRVLASFVSLYLVH